MSKSNVYWKPATQAPLKPSRTKSPTQNELRTKRLML